MTIDSEFTNLKQSKTSIRKSIQRKNTGLTLEEIYPNYHTYIKNMNDNYTPDETNLLNYVENRVKFLTLSVTKIRPYAFREFTCLQKLYLTNSSVVILTNINAFSGVTPEILVPSSLVNSYKSAANWSLIADRIKAYSTESSEDMYILQHIEHVQTIGWLQSKTVGELHTEFRF